MSIRPRLAGRGAVALVLGALPLALLGRGPAAPGPEAAVAEADGAPAPAAAGTSRPAARFVVRTATVDVDPRALAADHGLDVVRAIPGLSALVLRGPAAALGGLRSDPRVERAARDRELALAGACVCNDAGAAGDPDAALAAADRRLDALLGPLRARATGRDVLVAVLDTGCDAAHPALADALAPGRSLVGEAWAEDRSGHGTAMASLVAARPPHADHAGLRGVAPGARVLPVQVASGRGRALASDVAAGLVYAVDRGARVVLLALGTPYPAPVLADAAAYAEARDVVVVAAAGNLNVHVDLHPAALETVLAVGCVDDDGRLARRTALAPTTDLLARGVEAAAALPRESWGVVTGTSVAAARAAGVAALVRERAPDLSAGEVRNLLRRATRPLELLAGDADLARAFPAGVLDAAAVAAALERGPRALPPQARPAAPAPPGPDIALVGVGADVTPAGGLVVRARVESRGGAAGAGEVTAELELARSGARRPLGRAPFRRLGPGAPAEVTIAVPPDRLPADARVATVLLRLVGPGPDAAPANDRAAIDVPVPANAGRGLETLYQQDLRENLIADAPVRVAPGRGYVPLLVFNPDQGDADPNTWIEVTRCTVRERTAALPNGSGRVLYDDVFNGAASTTTAAPGTVVLDEEGQPVLDAAGSPDLRLFQHDTLRVPGRYNIIRLPRAAFGVAPVPARDEVRFLEVELAWRSRRRFLGSVSIPRSGTRRWVLRVALAAEPLPQLPGGGRYFDAHVHTITEWNQDDSFDPLSPKRNHGGPIPMVKEAAYALGLTDAVDAVRGRVVTSDHNAGYNVGDTLTERPQLGPTSPASAGPGVSEWEAMRRIFGIAASEEITLHGQSTTSVGSVSIPIPKGPHMLSYRAGHLEGAWHGGSALFRLLGDPSPDVLLSDVLQWMARDERAKNRRAATFAAHPFGDWTLDHYRTAFELDPANRTDATVHVEGTGFVSKGIQLWNGDGKRNKLPDSRVDWDDVNPWADADFVRGRDDWDERIYEEITQLHHDLIEPCLEYELDGRPGVRFPRKVLLVAGTDAHGDFNYRTGRKATLINVQSTYKVDGRAFGEVRTYAVPDLQPPAGSPEERAFEAMLDGNSVLTDGPLLSLALDAEDRFDGADLAWRDASPAWADADGRLGGGGAFDGLGTALVRRGSTHVRLGYRYTNTTEHDGDVEAIGLYRTSVGDPNPTGRRPSGSVYVPPRGWLAAAGPDRDLEEALDPTEEGTIQAPTVLQAGAWTEPDPRHASAEARRCYTNPIWCVPFDARATVAAVATDPSGDGFIPPGGLRVELDFDMSLEPAAYTVEVKALDASGESSDRATAPIDVLTPVGPGNGWSARGGVADARYTLENAAPIPLNLDRWPAGGDRVTFCVYFFDAPRDPFGNALNRPAFTFSVQGAGTGGGTGPGGPRQGTTAPGATPGGAGAPASGGGGGGCALRAAGDAGDAGDAGGAAPAGALALALLAAAALGRRARRRSASGERRAEGGSASGLTPERRAPRREGLTPERRAPRREGLTPERESASRAGLTPEREGASAGRADAGAEGRLGGSG